MEAHTFWFMKFHTSYKTKEKYLNTGSIDIHEVKHPTAIYLATLGNPESIPLFETLPEIIKKY